jgi:hypothetical protein
MSTGKIEEKLENYREEDRKLLVSILNEYTEKLSISCENIDKSLTLQSRKLFDVNTLIFFIICCGISILLAEKNSDIRLFLYRNFGIIPISVTWVLTVLSIIMLFALIGRVFELSNVLFKTNELIRDVRIISKKLEKVVQIVSQMQEHSENRVASRVEMDLRLADAEIALDHYESLSRRRKEFNKLLGRSLRPLARASG